MVEIGWFSKQEGIFVYGRITPLYIRHTYFVRGGKHGNKEKMRRVS